jgi:hypothetical protein
LQLLTPFTWHATHGGRQTPAQRSRRVVSKVVVIHLINGVDEQPKFDIEYLPRGLSPAAYLGIHTRTSDKSRSTSKGFAM